MKAIENWRGRHLKPVNFWLHMAGIPASFVAAPVLLVLRMWWWATAAFVLGYALQFIGHAIEGNRSGEEELFRRIVRRTHPIGDTDAEG